jgi:RimJ/RimL family protein N-acetyltransferase
MPPLTETSRLRLRPPGMGDAVRIAELLNNFAVTGNLSVVPFPYSLEDARNWLGQWRADAAPTDMHFIIELANEGAVGVIGNHIEDDNAHIGFWLGEPFWNQGIMSEALKAVLNWYFDTTLADKVTSGVFHFNMASLAVQQKLGFVETGRSTLHCLARGEDIEHIDTELTREAFEALALKCKG